MSILDRVSKTTKEKEPNAKAAKKSEKKTEKKAAKPQERLLSKKVVNTLLNPVVSEKAARLSDAGVVVFRVKTSANKIEVKNAFKELYKVTPVKINFIKMRGLHARFGKVAGKTKDYKKALITLPKGTRVDVFEGV